MKYKVGNIVKCVKDGYMIPGGEQFCIKGKSYEIIRVPNSGEYYIKRVSFVG